MGETISPNPENFENEYLDAETLAPAELEKILETAPVSNLRKIEELGQLVAPHRDIVLIGDLGHKDQVYEGEVNLPTGKKLLVVYKPDSGAGRGNLIDKDFTNPENASPPSSKEIASWIMAEKLGLGHLSVPTIARTLDQGIGSIRPYINGETLASLDEDKIDRVYEQTEDMEDFALYDYVLGYLDRLKQQNLICKNEEDKFVIKSIDHSLTFFTDKFTSQFVINGPRLTVAYDNSTDPPRLLNRQLPERLMSQLETFIDHENETREELHKYLNDEEIESAIQRVHQTHEKGIFL